MIDAIKIYLGGLGEIRSGYPLRGAISPVSGGSTLVVQMRDVASDRPLHWPAVVRTELTGRQMPEWLTDGDVLLVTRGNRYYAVALENVPDRTVSGPHLYHLRLKPNSRLLPAFLAWQLNQSPIQRHLHQAAEGSNQLSIRRAELEALSISVPPIVDQQRIVRLAELAARERVLLEQLIRNREQELGALALVLAGPIDTLNN